MKPLQTTLSGASVTVLLFIVIGTSVSMDVPVSNGDYAGLSKRARPLFNHMKLLNRLRQKGQSDRYRFFHAGLGKRSHPNALDHVTIGGSLYPENLSGFDLDNSFLPEMEFSASFLNDILKNSEIYRRMSRYNNMNEDKRSPEIFSESLYPIQSGKQQLEAMLDKSLNIPTDVAIETSGNDIDSESSDESEMNANDVTAEITENENSAPIDLLFRSQDMDELDMGVSNKRDANKQDNAKVAKRWWAAEALNNFRAPKSSRFFSIHKGRHVDPVLYFIGLGK